MGVNVFGDMSDSTAGRADPMAQTSIGSGIQDQINLEGVGSGAVLLPHYSPLKVAETFRLLHALFPGRIDLGLGRAPGSDQTTFMALRRDPRASDNFPEDVVELHLHVRRRVLAAGARRRRGGDGAALG